MTAPFAVIRKWGEFVKFSHSVFALPFALAAMAVAARETRGWPGWRLFGLIVLATVSARTCAMAFNRIVDREFDGANPRTASRHLPAGAISLASAWTLCLVSAAIFIVAAYWINRPCFYLSPVALVVLGFYSLTKRFTDFTHFFLGVALGLAPIGAWLAVQGSVDLQPLILACAVVGWLVGFDIIYAIQDYEFDRKAGLHSLVVRWGIANALQFACLCHLLTWVLLAIFGVLARFRMVFWFGLILILGCFLLEHWLARKRSLKWVNIAFFRLNAVVSVVFFVATVAEVIFPGFRRMP